MIALFWILGFIILVTLLIYLRYFMPLRKNEAGFEYVYVEDDGTARELSREERGYLKEKFETTDGARPYIKSRYNSKTPDGKIGGYIERKRVPQKIEIVTPIIDKEIWRRKWLLLLQDLTNLEYQKQIWLNPKNTNPYYSFVEFRCSYFDDLELTDGYKRQIESGYISTQEYEKIEKWHKLIAEYIPPNNDDNDNQAILNDEKWLEIIGLGKESIEKLKPNLNSIERSLLV